jgi:hypothetical protein
VTTSVNSAPNSERYKGARKNEEDQIDLSIPAEFDVQGAKLITLTQAIAYRGIKETNKVPTRRTTMGNLQKTRIAIQEYTNTLETDESIWLSIRKPEIQTKIRQFLYKTMHGTQKIGKFWSSIPMLAHHEHCQTCGMTETMEHILTKCKEPLARIIWPLVERAWPNNQLDWPRISIGIILGCGRIKKHENHDQDNQNENALSQQKHQGAARLATILISEAAHLIWVLRCERVIHERHHSDNEITTRWKNIINTRLVSDKIIATKIKHENKFTNLVKNTWKPLLIKEGPLPHDWIINSEVLVGRRPRNAPIMEDD